MKKLLRRLLAISLGFAIAVGLLFVLREDIARASELSPGEKTALAGTGLVLASIVAVLASFAFWLWMLVDCCRRDFRGSEKIVWVLLLLFLNALGAILYFAIGRPAAVTDGDGDLEPGRHTTVDWILLYRARDEPEAHLIRQALDLAGVPAQLAGGKAAVGFGDLPANALLVDVFVPRAQAEAARGAVARWFAEGAPDEGEPGPEWTCAACGEASPAGFALCWSCGAQRRD